MTKCIEVCASNQHTRQEGIHGQQLYCDRNYGTKSKLGRGGHPRYPKDDEDVTTLDSAGAPPLASSANPTPRRAETILTEVLDSAHRGLSNMRAILETPYERLLV